MPSTDLGVNVYGYDKSASATLKKIGKEAENTGGAFSKIKNIAAGVFSGNILTSAVSQVENFAKESINAFQEVGGQVLQIQRVTGGTAEDASKLRFAFEETGLSADQAQMTLKKFSQVVLANKKPITDLGISTRDSSGHIKSMNELLLETADKFSKMPNGVQKTAEAVNLFGRSGLQMLPFLNKGRQGLLELEQEAQKYGLVLTANNLKAVQANIMAHREFTAAMSGLQVQLGQYLYPALTALASGFAKIVPILTTLLRPAFEAIGNVVGKLVPFIQEVVGWIIQMGQHFEKTGTSMGIFSSLGKDLGKIWGDIKEVFAAVFPILKALGDFIVTVLAPVLGVVLLAAWKATVIAVGAVKDAIIIVINVFKDLWNIVKVVGDAISKVFGFIVDGFKMEVNGIIDLINGAIGLLDKIHIKLPSFLGGAEFGINIPKIPHLAEGGVVSTPTVALIGEAGPEAVVPLSKTGMGQGMNVTINVQGSVIAQKDLVIQVRNEMAQLLRRKGAPISALGL